MALESIAIKTERLTLSALHNGVKTGTPVIAFHGWLDNAASFIPLLDAWECSQPFYAVELPGHGLSEHRPKSCSYQLLENIVDVAAVVKALCPDDAQVILIGHSLGGIICSLYAAASPERVEKLVLLDSLGPITDETAAVLPQLRRAMKRAEQFRSSKLVVYPDVEMAAKVRRSGIGRIGMSAAQLLVQRGLKKVEGGYCWTSDPRLMEPSFLRFTEKQVEAIFRGIDCPICLICGEQGYFSETDAVRTRMSYLEQVEHHVVTGGHHFHMEGDVEKTSQIIQAFIA